MLRCSAGQAEGALAQTRQSATGTAPSRRNWPATRRWTSSDTSPSSRPCSRRSSPSPISPTPRSGPSARSTQAADGPTRPPAAAMRDRRPHPAHRAKPRRPESSTEPPGSRRRARAGSSSRARAPAWRRTGVTAGSCAYSSRGPRSGSATERATGSVTRSSSTTTREFAPACRAAAGTYSVRCGPLLQYRPRRKPLTSA